MPPGPAPATPGLADSILALLRGEIPRQAPDPGLAEAWLERYECGGYLHDRFSRAGTLDRLPAAWAGPIGRAHRRTVLDNLAALAEFRRMGAILAADGTPLILLKGAAYLIDLYDDPGARRLTDIDLLIRRSDARTIAARLKTAGFAGEVGGHFPENRRFEMWFPGTAQCRLEFHWSLGLPLRARIDQDAVWDRSLPSALEGVFCRRLAPEDAILYHSVHAADSYFGPSLKWVIDLREMCRAWRFDPDVLVGRGVAWRCRTALHLALSHVEKVFPGTVPEDLLRRTAPGGPRRRLLALYRASDPLALVSPDSRSRWRYPLRCLMMDSPIDAVLLSIQVLARPITRPVGRALGRAVPPWEGSD